MLAKQARDRLFTPSFTFGMWFGAVTLGAALGLAANTSGGIGWMIFTLLVLSAAVVSIAQQTLP